MENSEKDQKWMQHALELARQGQYTARPNPCVGAVLVKDEQMIGCGWHQCTGEAHAEIHALQAAGNTAKGATCYVSLEPCAHHGRTPPCCEALVKAGVSRVVVAMRDPHPKVNGQGIIYLQNHGIEVRVGVLESAARDLNRDFIKRIEQRKPWVSLKLGMTLDGKISDFSGNSQWITGNKARLDVQTLRARHAAIMSTATTVIADKARLSVRELPADLPLECQNKFKQPLRVLLDRTLKTDFNEVFFQQAGDILIYTQSPTLATERVGLEVIPMAADTKGYLSLATILEDLAQRQINSVLIEAGGQFSAQMLQSELVDEWIIYLSGKILGSQGQSAFYWDKALALSESLVLKFKTIELCDEDIKIVAFKDKPKPQA